MKALSVRAPWWWFILHAGKDIENRDWHTNFRGTVYLHASKWFSLQEVYGDSQEAMGIAREANPTIHAAITFGEMKATGGCLVGKIDILDCVSESASPWFFGEFGFVLSNPVVFDKPIPFKGALGFFNVPEGLI
jgi:hypothetical protein